MERDTAQTIFTLVSELASELAQLRSIIDTQPIHEQSNEFAWQIHRDCMALQIQIACHLPSYVLLRPYAKMGTWWEEHDRMPMAVVHELFRESVRLIISIAYAEPDDTKEPDYALGLLENIAGMLHPKARKLALNDRNRVPQ